MKTNKWITLGFALFAVACGGSDQKEQSKNDQRTLAVVPGGSGIEGCENIQSVCTASYPSTCYDFCADAPPECEKVQVCTMSYPSTCYEFCKEPTLPPGDCGNVSSAVDSEGNEFPICLPPGGGGTEPGDPGGTEPGDPTNPGEPCTIVTICTQSYPPVCHDVCQEEPGGGGGSEPGCSEPGCGEPGGSEPGSPPQG